MAGRRNRNPGGGIGFPGGGRRGGSRYPGGGGMGGYGPHTQSAGTAEIAQASGGDSTSINQASAFEDMLERIRQRYSLHFSLPEGIKPGEERQIEVQLSAAARRRYPDAEVRYRRVYLTPDGSYSDRSSPTMTSKSSSATTEIADDPPAGTKATGSSTTPQRRRAVDESTGPRVLTEPQTQSPPAKDTSADAQSPTPAAPPDAAPEPKRGWRRVADDPAKQSRPIPPATDAQPKP